MMSLSKLWLFVLTVITGLLVLVFLLSPGRVQHSLGEAATSRLDLAQRSANFLLQNSARRWIDIASQLATDAVVQSSLEELGRGEAEPRLLHDTAQRHRCLFFLELRAQGLFHFFDVLIRRARI